MDESVSESAERDDAAWNMLTDMTKKGFLKMFNSAREIRNFLGRDPLLSKMHVLTKTFHDR
eukprot:8960633-Heterocapsa_arctica.AAC.1